MSGDHWQLLSAWESGRHVRMNREIFPEYLEPEEFEEKVNRFVPFATNGCGDDYGYRVLPDGRTDAAAICIWEHGLFGFREVAGDLAERITRDKHSEI